MPFQIRQAQSRRLWKIEYTEHVRSVHEEEPGEDVKRRSYLDEVQTRAFISVKFASPPHPVNLRVAPLMNGTSSVLTQPIPSSLSSYTRIFSPMNSRKISGFSLDLPFDLDLEGFSISRKALKPFLDEMLSLRRSAVFPVRPFSLIFMSQ